MERIITATARSVVGLVLVVSGCYSGLPGQRDNGGGDSASDGGSGGDSAGGADGGSGDDGGVAPLDCEDTRPGIAPLRRLSYEQYDNTIRDVFMGAAQPSELFPETQDGFAFSTMPDANNVSLLAAEEIMNAAEDVAVQVTENLDVLVNCEAMDEDACVRDFFATYGKRAFRRPMRTSEVDILMDAFFGARDDGFEPAVGAAVSLMLQMPQFLYIVEEGEPAELGGVDAVRLTDYEVAARLSYLFWNTIPDEELMAAADAGALREPEQIESQARRLLSSDLAQPVIAKFHREWLEIEALTESDKDVETYPAFDQSLADSMTEQVGLFAAHMYRDGGTFDELLTGEVLPVNGRLATFFGQQEVSADLDWQFVSVDAERYAGILTLPGVTATHGSAKDSNIVLRGVTMRRQLLCENFPPPPGDADEVEETIEGDTQRERSIARQALAECGGCHSAIDPVGFLFENYDGIGQWRDTYSNGQAVDARGELVGAGEELAGPVDGAVELGARLAQSVQAQQCFVSNWHHYLVGQEPDPVIDGCGLEQVTEAFVDSGYDLGELLIGLTQTDGFRYRLLEDA